MLTPLQAGTLKGDSGRITTVSQVLALIGRTVMRDGQKVTIVNGGLWGLEGKRGTGRVWTAHEEASSPFCKALTDGPARTRARRSVSPRQAESSCAPQTDLKQAGRFSGPGKGEARCASKSWWRP